ncbi:MAG TPA: hypothetical protein VF711_04040 [Acidimicrobiales bacterium]|jgi:hypothetical protein
MFKAAVSEGGVSGGADLLRAIPDHEEFLRKWNALATNDRRRIRRIVKLGRPLDDPGEAVLAVGYARFQRSRLWARLFWLWFVPGLILAIGVASQIHPLMIGVVLALSAQALNTRRNLRRVETVNTALLSERRGS